MLIFLSVLCILLVIAIVLLVSALNYSFAKIEIYERWVVELEEDVSDTYEEMKRIDDRQIFEKDDEVGFAFVAILELLKKLRDKVDYEEK